MEFTISCNGTVGKAVSLGGELVSFVKDGVEYVWYGKEEHWSGRAPCLFPVVCRAKDDKITVDGKDYPMKKHGIARKTEFVPLEVTPCSVTFRFTENEETLKSYPFKFFLDITHTVCENGFTTEYRVTNTNDCEMPFCIGGHPGFNCPLLPGESFEDYSLCFDDAAGVRLYNCESEGGYTDDSMPQLDYIKNDEFKLFYGAFDNDAVIAENLPKKAVSLVNRSTGKGFRFEFDSFDAIGFWTPVKKNSPFICLEPWNGLPGNVGETSVLKDKKYAKTLSPGESFATSYKVTVI